MTSELSSTVEPREPESLQYAHAPNQRPPADADDDTWSYAHAPTQPPLAAAVDKEHTSDLPIPVDDPNKPPPDVPLPFVGENDDHQIGVVRPTRVRYQPDPEAYEPPPARRFDPARWLRSLAGIDERLMRQVWFERARHTAHGGIILGTGLIAGLSMWTAINESLG